MAVYGPVRHQQNIIWTEASESIPGPYNVILTGCANKDK